MFGGHFYHAILRKSVAIFGTLFNDINIIRQSGTSGQIVKVPLSYGPKQKFIARIEGQKNLSSSKIAIKIPRLSFEITSLTYDTESKLNRFNKLVTNQTGDSADSVSFVPYKIGMQLNILAKNQDEGLQILEQILPIFQPEYTVSANLVDGVDQNTDVPISLEGVSISDDYEGDFEARRVLVYTLDFTMRVKFFGSAATNKLVKATEVTFLNAEDDAHIENLNTRVAPFGSDGTDDFGIVESKDFIPTVTSITMTVSGDIASGFGSNEPFLGETSAIYGLVSRAYDETDNETTFTLTNLEGFPQIGENLVGLNTSTTVEVTNYTVN